MRTKLKIAIISLSACAGLMSCIGTSSKSGYSPLTGDKYNNSEGTGFEVKFGYKSKTPPGMVPIEGGTFDIGQRGEFVTAPRDNPQRRITVSSFFMDQYEVRNVDWREYTHWMQLVFGRVAPELVQKAQPNVKIWREELAYNEPYLQNYFTSPAYNDYPIVGITWEQAMEYCSWRTDRVNEQALINAGIIAKPNYGSLANLSKDSIVNNFVFNTQKYVYQDAYQPALGANPKKDLYGANRKVDFTDGVLFSDFRLPTEAEWEFAAYAPLAGKDGILHEGKIYPWKGYQTRNVNRKELGKMQANFVRGRGDMMGPSGSLNDKANITAPVNWYTPNDFGLYNMAGNVNEWVLDVYRSTSSGVVSEYNSFRGNVYMKPVVAGSSPTGRPIYALDELGRVKTQVEQDVRNYKDGDMESRIDFSLDSLQMQNDSTDLTDILRPVISDKTRVYKGGSWKDRIYWLNPSTRRYLDQDKSSNDIGFRCAMNMVGDIDQLKK